jgi:hypothetical protein
MNRSMFGVLIAAGLLGVVPEAAPAQWVPPAGYNPWVNPWGWNGGQIAGQAQMINAVGQLNMDNEKARIEREKANQAKLDTQKQAFDQMLYERSLKPTLAEDVNYEQNRIVARMMSSPTGPEITRGKTLNAFLPYVMKLAQMGVQGPPVPINQLALKQVNVSTGPGGPQVGILRSLPLHWPMALRGPLQQKFDPLLSSAVSLTISDNLDPKTAKELRSQLKLIEDDFLNRFRAEEISTTAYLNAVPFLDQLKLAVRALELPNAAQFLNGSMAAQGNTVPELVQAMSFNGTTFAPGNPGSEAAYRSLHDSFVSYIRTAQAASGFQPRMRPPDPLAANR